MTKQSELQEEDETSALQSALRWIALLFAVIAVGAFAFVFASRDRGPYSGTCPPHEPRPWAQASFRERTAPGPAEPWPDLTTSPVPKYTTSVIGDSVSVGFPQRLRQTQDRWKHYERVACGIGETVALPGAAGLEVTLATWHATPLEWLDPSTGELFEGTDVIPRAVHGKKPLAFIIHVARSDTGSPPLDGTVRAHAAALFDRDTGVKLSDGCGWSFQDGVAYYMLDSAVRHRANLMLEVPLAYGEAKSYECPWMREPRCQLNRT